MAHTLEEAARATVIELITRGNGRDDKLSPTQVKLLQASLKQLDLYGGKIDGAPHEETGKGIGEFLKRPENQNYISLVSDEAKASVRSYATLMERNKRPTELYNEVFGKTYSTIPARSLETVLSQPNTLRGEDIVTLKRGLGGKNPDGYFRIPTGKAVIEHLNKHPADWTTIGTPMLRLMEGSPEVLEQLQKTRMPREYFDRVSSLLKELDPQPVRDREGNILMYKDIIMVDKIAKDGKVMKDPKTGENLQEIKEIDSKEPQMKFAGSPSGNGGAIYELQTLLRAGGFLRIAADGEEGRATFKSVHDFEAERTRRGYRADASGFDPGAPQYAESNADGSGIKPPATPDPVQETTRVASAAPPAGFKPFG